MAPVYLSVLCIHAGAVAGSIFVSANYHTYKGSKSCKMDPKYRVSVQPAWRPEGGGSLFLMDSAEYELPMIKVLTREAYDERVNRVLQSDKPLKEKDRLLGKLAELCCEASINDQGKMLVPKETSTRAGIEANGEVVLVGRGIHFEIWSKSNYDLMKKHEAGVEDDDLNLF